MFKIFKRFIEFSGAQKKLFFQTIALQVVFSILEAIRIPAIAIVLNDLFDDKRAETQNIILSTAIIGVSMILGSVVKSLLTMKQTEAGYHMVEDKRINIGEHLRYVPMGFFKGKNLAQITSVVTNTLNDMQETATTVIRTVMAGFISTFIIAVMMLVFDVRIGIVVFIGILIFMFENSRMQKCSEKLSAYKVETDDTLIFKVLEFVLGIGVVKSYNLTEKSNMGFEKAIDDNMNANYMLEKKYIPYIAVQSLLLKIIGLLMIAFSIVLYLQGFMSMTKCILIIVSSFIIFSQLETIGAFSSVLRQLDIEMDKVNEIFEMPVIDKEGREIVPDNYDIHLRNVEFSYKDRKIINGVSMDIPTGSLSAIIGFSGSGKSTLCSLIPRFWDVDSGEIIFGGHNVKEYSYDSLIRNISVVFQNVYLFHDTIYNNIKFGKPDATYDEVRSAAERACCIEFIENFENGFDTIIGEGGANLSGGEKQRISIARALLKDSPVIILDEATASIDPENERQLQQAIDELTNSKTVIVIAHRMKTIRNADCIYVLGNDGKIAQSGTHEELMRQGGIYSDFVNAKNQATGWKISG